MVKSVEAKVKILKSTTFLQSGREVPATLAMTEEGGAAFTQTLCIVSAIEMIREHCSKVSRNDIHTDTCMCMHIYVNFTKTQSFYTHVCIERD